MPQLSLYLDEPSMAELKQQASRRNMSLSSYARACITGAQDSLWPEGYWDLYGSISDDSFEAPEEIPAELDQLDELFA